MTSPPPAPYGLLDAPAFPFRALAALAGRLPLGGAREAALACLLAARLARAALAPHAPAPEARRARAAATARWLLALPLDAELRDAAVALCDAAAAPSPALPAASLAAPLRRVRRHAAAHLDAAADLELAALLLALDAPPTEGAP